MAEDSELFRLEFDPHARRQLRRIQGTDRRRIDEMFDTLTRNPRPPRVLMLQRGLFRVPVRKWRIFYVIDDRQRRIVVTDVLRRNEGTYRSV